LNVGIGNKVVIAVGLLLLSTIAMADTLTVGGPVTGTTLTIQDSALSQRSILGGRMELRPISILTTET